MAPWDAARRLARHLVPLCPRTSCGPRHGARTTRALQQCGQRFRTHRSHMYCMHTCRPHMHSQAAAHDSYCPATADSCVCVMETAVHSCWPRKSMDGRRKLAHSGRLGAMKAAPEVVSEYGASTFARPRLAEGDDAKNYRFATGAQICCCTKTLCTTGLVTPWLSPNVPEITQETSNHWNVR